MNQKEQVAQAVEISPHHMADLGCPGCSSITTAKPTAPKAVELSSLHMADLGCPGCSSITSINTETIGR